MDSPAGHGRNPVRKPQIQPEYMEMRRLARDGLPNPSRETKFSGANGDREMFIFHFPCSADHEQD